MLGPFTGRVAAVIPVYNEDPEVLKACVASIVDQVDECWVVDDGSDVPVWSYGSGVFWRSHLHQFTENRGKRAAVAYGLRNIDADIIVTVDSDTLVAPGAVAKLVEAFHDTRVNAATGMVRATNGRKNLLTKLIDLRYAAVFLGERAAFSAFGSVLCCCGSLAAYRMSAVARYADDLETQTFLGRKVAGGDDRRMTNYALSTGRAVLVEDARASTLVPERWGHFARQQTRWARSFFRETWWAILHLSGRARVLAFTEMALQIGFTVGLLYAAWHALYGLALGLYLMWTVAAAYARMSPAWRDTEPAPLWLAPLYGLLTVVLLLPIRLFALATLRNGAWGTRQTVEVSR